MPELNAKLSVYGANELKLKIGFSSVAAQEDARFPPSPPPSPPEGDGSTEVWSAEELKKKDAEELKAKQAAEAKKAKEKDELDAKNIARMQELEAGGKKVSGGMHKFDSSEVDVNGGSATADDFMDAFGF